MAKKKAHRKCPPCTQASMFRNEFAMAKRKGNCGRAADALSRLKTVVSAQADEMSPQTRRLAFRELLQKQHQVNTCAAKQESSDSNRFNGLLGLGILGIL